MCNVNLAYLSSIHNGPHSHSESLCRHFTNVSSKEPGVGFNSLNSECLNSCSGYKTGSWLVECNVPIRTNSCQRQNFENIKYQNNHKMYRDRNIALL